MTREMVGKIGIMGRQVEVVADMKGFWTFYGGAESGEGSERRQTLAYGKNFENCVAAVRAKFAKASVKVAVPFFTNAGEKGVADSVHAGNGDILVTIEGERGRLRPHDTVLKAETPPEEIERMLRAVETEHAARQERRSIESEYEMRIGHAVEAAIREKVEAQEKEEVA